MRAALVLAFVCLFAIVAAEAACAASCSSWRAVCVKRATAVNPAYLPECDAKFDACLSSGCFTEGAKFGGASHCGLTKK
jgi:hypothetical protein